MPDPGGYVRWPARRRGALYPQLAADEMGVGDPGGVVAERLGELHLLDDGRDGLAAENADVEPERAARRRAAPS
jgi:hypothetical protein